MVLSEVCRAQGGHLAPSRISEGLEIPGRKGHGQTHLVGREFLRLTAVIPFILWRQRHLHDRRAEEILQRHEEAGLQETPEAHPQASGTLGSSSWSGAHREHFKPPAVPKGMRRVQGRTFAPLLPFRQDLAKSWGFRRS